MSNSKYSCKAALKLLKSGFKFKSISGSVERIFRCLNDKIYITSENESYILSQYEFLDLFSNEEFMIINEEIEDEVDPKKDEEYYSFRQ